MQNVAVMGRRNPNPRQSIFLDGGPAGGKSTRGKILAETLGYKYIDTGDLLRQSKDPEILEMMSKGEYVPDYKILHMIKSEIKKSPYSSMVFVGIRNVPQAHDLFLTLCNYSHKVIYLGLLRGMEECFQLSQSRSRKDDHDEVFLRRWELFEEHSPKIQQFFCSRPVVSVMHYEMTHNIDEDKWKLLEMLSPHCGDFNISDLRQNSGNKKNQEIPVSSSDAYTNQVVYA